MPLLILAVALICLSKLQAQGLDFSLQKCDIPCAAPLQEAQPPFEAMRAIFASDSSIEEFFSYNFERSFFHIPHSIRSDRSAWMQHYRRFLPSADLDLILSHNASFTDSRAALALHDDLDVFRIAKSQSNVHTWTALYVKPHLDSLRAAVRDGAVLHLYHMSSRSNQIARFEDALRHFWTVPVSSTLSFHPPATDMQPEPAPSIFAGDQLIVIIHGNATANLYTDYFPFPSSHHIENPSIQKASYESKAKPKSIDIDEGDVLYVPRGTAVDIRTKDSLALIVTFEIHTHQRMLFHGVLRTVDLIHRKSNLLSTAISKTLTRRNANKYDTNTKVATWSDVVKTAVNMAAEFTPAMRRFLPVSGNVLRAMEDSGMDVGAQAIQDTVGRFSRAATNALFNPMLEILVSDDEKVGAIAGQDVITWAKHLFNGADGGLEMAERTFLAVIQDLAVASTTTPSESASALSADWSELADKRKDELLIRHASLRRHGEYGISAHTKKISSRTEECTPHSK